MLLTEMPRNLKVLQARIRDVEFVSIWGKVEFENADDNKYNIRKGIINCNSFFSFKNFSKQDIGSNLTDLLFPISQLQECISESIKVW